MESQGQKGLNNPKIRFTSMLSRRNKLQEELRTVEKQVYELETSYLQESATFGNAFKGFEGFLSTSKNANNSKRLRKFQTEDRVFSLSSVTSPAVEELRVGKEDGKPDVVQGRSKGGLPTTVQGKPKKGRTGNREGKKIKLTSDLDPDDDDDLI